MLNVTEIRSKVAEINRMVIELFDRLVVAQPVEETVIPIVHMPNI